MFDYQDECRVLIRNLSIGNFAEARLNCAILFEKISQLHSVSIDYVKHILYYLYDQLYAYSTSRHLRSTEHQSAADYAAPDLAVQELEHLSKACAQIEVLLEQIISQQLLLETGQKVTNELVHEALAYIRIHYQNENLSLPVISEYLRVSPAYLSRLFSSALSMSISDYIAHLRIRHAKALLSSDLPVTVEQAASASGFFTVQTFIRTFKKYEHMTPGAYQKKMTRRRNES